MTVAIEYDSYHFHTQTVQWSLVSSIEASAFIIYLHFVIQFSVLYIYKVPQDTAIKSPEHIQVILNSQTSLYK